MSYLNRRVSGLIDYNLNINGKFSMGFNVRRVHKSEYNHFISKWFQSLLSNDTQCGDISALSYAST